LRTDGDNLLLGGLDGILRIWTLRTGSEMKQIKGSSDAIESIAVSKDGSTVVLGASNSIRVLKIKSITE
jgi:WD40 repeat protein